MIDLIFNTLLVIAQLGDPEGLNIPNSGDGNEQLKNIINLVYMLSAIIAVVVIIIAGIQFSLSNGNAQTVSKAKNAIIYSVVGLVIITSAFAITSFILGRMS